MKNLFNYIIEKILINSNTPSQENVFWFTKHTGIKLPFDLKVSSKGGHIINITIEKILLSKRSDKSNYWGFYDIKERNVLNLIDRHLSLLLFSPRHTIISTIQDSNLEKEIGKSSVVVKFKDVDKIIADK